MYVEKNKNEKKTWISRAPDRVRQRRQSSLSIGTYSWVFTDFSFLRRGTRFFWRTCVEPWSLLRVFLLVMGVDENSGNSSPQLQNMKRKYDMKSLWLMWLWHLFFATTLDERSENFVFISSVHSSSLCDLSSMSCSPKPHLKNDELFTSSGYHETRSCFWTFHPNGASQYDHFFWRMLVLY